MTGFFFNQLKFFVKVLNKGELFMIAPKNDSIPMKRYLEKLYKSLMQGTISTLSLFMIKRVLFSHSLVGSIFMFQAV